MPVAHVVRATRARRLVTEAGHLTLGSSSRPLTIRINITSRDLRVFHVLVLTLLTAATLRGRPVAHRSRRASRLVIDS